MKLIILDCIVLVVIICMLYVATIYQAPILFLFGCAMGMYMGYILKEHLRNASQ